MTINIFSFLFALLFALAGILNIIFDKAIKEAKNGGTDTDTVAIGAATFMVGKERRTFLCPDRFC